MSGTFLIQLLPTPIFGGLLPTPKETGDWNFNNIISNILNVLHPKSECL